MTTEGERPAERSPDRLRIIERIAGYEREGEFGVGGGEEPDRNHAHDRVGRDGDQHADHAADVPGQ